MTVETWLRLTRLGGSYLLLKQAPYHLLLENIPEKIKKETVFLDARYPLARLEDTDYTKVLWKNNVGEKLTLYAIEKNTSGGASRYVRYWEWLNYIRWARLTFKDNEPLANFLIQDAVSNRKRDIMAPLHSTSYSSYVEDLKLLNPIAHYNTLNLYIPKELCGVTIDVLTKTVSSGIIKEFI